MNHQRLYRIAPLLVAILVGCRSASSQSILPTPTPLPTPVAVVKPTYSVQRGTVISTLDFQGRVTPVNQQELYFRNDGYVRVVYVDRGDSVKTGDVLAELELGDLEAQLAQGQLSLQIAEARLEKAEQDNADALAEAQIRLERARLELAQARSSTSSAVVTAAEVNLTRAQGSVTDAEREYQESLERQWETDEGRAFYAAQLDQARQNLAVAQAQYDDALAGQSAQNYGALIAASDVSLLELEIEQFERGGDPLLELDIAAARLNIELIQAQIDAGRLVAPYDGVVLSLGITAGSQATAFQSVMLVGNPDAVEVVAEINAQSVGVLNVGQAAIVTLAGSPGMTFVGQVQALPRSGDSDRSVHIALEIQDIVPGPGDLATIQVQLEMHEDVLWLPPAAIRTFQSREFVVVQEGDIQRRVDVHIGLRSEDRVEILEGPTYGQIVIGP